MFSSRNRYILAILAALALFIGIKGRRTTVVGVPASTQEPTPAVPQLSITSDIDRLSLRIKVNPEIEFERTGETWKMTKPGASEVSADFGQMLKMLASVEVVDVAGSGASDDDKAKFGLRDDQAIRVKYWRGASVREAVFGKTQGGATITTLDGAPKLYRLRGLSEYALLRPASAWRNLSIWTYDEATVTDITLKSKGEDFTIKPSVGLAKWQIVEHQKASEKLFDNVVFQRVADVRSMFSSLVAEDIVDSVSAATAGFEPPMATVTVRLTGNATPLVLEVGAVVPGREPSRYARRPGRPYVYVLPPLASSRSVSDLPYYAVGTGRHTTVAGSVLDRIPKTPQSSGDWAPGVPHK